MVEFVRSLPRQLVDALGKLAGRKARTGGRKRLDNPALHLAIREGYLNVYAKGQSVFKIELDEETKNGVRRPVMKTHYKYLLIPKMPRKRRICDVRRQGFSNEGSAHQSGLPHSNVIQTGRNCAANR